MLLPVWAWRDQLRARIQPWQGTAQAPPRACPRTRSREHRAGRAMPAFQCSAPILIAWILSTGGAPAARWPMRVIGLFMGQKSKSPGRLQSSGAFYLSMAERVGFEPTVPLPVRLISSQVHSTTLPPLLVTGSLHRETATITDFRAPFQEARAIFVRPPVSAPLGRPGTGAAPPAPSPNRRRSDSSPARPPACGPRRGRSR